MLTEQNKNVFCPLPWYSVTGQKNGRIGVCCMNSLTEEKYSFGNISQGKISSFWNNHKLKKLRQDLLKGKTNSYCDGCYKKEEKGIISLRQKSLEYQKDIIPQIRPYTEVDGTCRLPIKKIDIRFSNLCNLACRMCSSSSSTLRIPLEKKLGLNYIEEYSMEPYDSDYFWKDSDFFSQLHQIDIAGGEPFINKNFYKLLKILIEQGYNKKIFIRIMTNATVLPGIFKGENFLWGKYTDIFQILEEFYGYNTSLSVDGYGGSYERIRIGSNWRVVKSNMDKIYHNCKNSNKASIDIMPTIQIDNIYDFPKLYLYARKKGINIDIKPLFRPEYLCITNLPYSEKSKIKIYYNALIVKYKNIIPEIKHDFEYIISYMYGKKGDQNIQSEYIEKSKIMDDFQSRFNLKL